MPRKSRAQKDARKAKAEAFKASQISNVNNNASTSQAAASQQDSALHCNARGPISHIIPDGEPQALTAGAKKIAEPVVESNIAEVVQVERDEKCSVETAKDGIKVGKRGSLNKSGEESVSLQPSQLETRQKQRVAGSSPVGNKSFNEDRNIDFNRKKSGQFKGYTGEDSRRGGGQQESYQSVERGRGGGQQASYQSSGRGRGGGQQESYPSVGRGRGGNYGYESQRGSYGYVSQAGSYGYGSQGGRDESGRIDALGRTLSTVLRHKAVGLGLKVRSDGYVAVKDLLSLSTKTLVGLPLHSHSVDDLKEAVKRDNKQRFGLHEENGQLLIRANQGHSIRTINSVELLNPIVSPEEVPVCVHGTYLRYLEVIKKEGLKSMNRIHIHFATGLCKEDGVISGMRSSCEVFIYLNVQKASK
ncbi:hypothetical protein KI387_009374, partial [Taxus chinensis]